MSELKTKIICTIGPASWNADVIKRMVDAGMTCARVNGAFADTAELDKVTNLVRSVSNEVNLMMDVKGPEVRLNKFAAPKAIKAGDTIIIGNDDTSEIYPGNHDNLYKHLKPGQRIVIGDGDVEMRIESIIEDKMHCVVVFGEELKPGKAMNLPGAVITTSALTEKDIVNLQHSIKLGWDSVSASFIQNKHSALVVKKYLEGSKMKLIAKIEDQQGIDNIDEILEVVDGIMIARGGLGVELGLEQVPMVQRFLIEKANEAGKPIITATQMLESMITNPRPTRAEVNDIATAIMIGSDSVMLSAESSVGKYAVEAVEWMQKTALAVEDKVRVRRFEGVATTLKFNQDHNDDLGRSAIAITDATAEACINLDIKAVFVVTKEGFTARMLSRHKIQQPIYAYVTSDSTARSLLLSGGVRPIVMSELESTRDEAVKHIVMSAKEKGIIQTNDLVAIVFGSKTFTGGDASILEIQRV
jgi:pyruvate kinase